MKLPKPPRITDEAAREFFLIAFFGLFGAGLYGYDWRIAGIVCGAIGMFFFYPRGR